MTADPIEPEWPRYAWLVTRRGDRAVAQLDEARELVRRAVVLYAKSPLIRDHFATIEQAVAAVVRATVAELPDHVQADNIGGRPGLPTRHVVPA
jgi:hypothetical protein